MYHVTLLSLLYLLNSRLGTYRLDALWLDDKSLQEQGLYVAEVKWLLHLVVQVFSICLNIATSHFLHFSRVGLDDK